MDRTKDFFAYVRIKCKGTQKLISLMNNNKEAQKIPDSTIVATGKAMLSNMRKFHKLMTNNQSKYLEINRFILQNSNHIFTNDDTLKFETQMLVFIKNVTVEVTQLSKLMANCSKLQLEEEEATHDYISHQQNIVKCLKFEISVLNNRIKNLIKAKANKKHMKNDVFYENNSTNNMNISSRHQSQSHRKYKRISSQKMDSFVNELLLDKHLSQFSSSSKVTTKRGNRINHQTNNNNGYVFAEDEEEKKNGERLSSVERETFKQESIQMLKILNSEQSQLEKAEQSTIEIVELLTTFIEQVVDQDSVIQNIYDSVHNAMDDIDAGNKQLTKAQERGQSTKTMFITIVLTLAFSLLFLDWYKH